MNELICFLFGHKYRLKRTITKDIRELNCKRCSKDFAMCDWTKSVLPLDNELKQLHEEFLAEK